MNVRNDSFIFCFFFTVSIKTHDMVYCWFVLFRSSAWFLVIVCILLFQCHMETVIYLNHSAHSNRLNYGSMFNLKKSLAIMKIGIYLFMCFFFRFLILNWSFQTIRPQSPSKQKAKHCFVDISECVSFISKVFPLQCNCFRNKAWTCWHEKLIIKPAGTSLSVKEICVNHFFMFLNAFYKIYLIPQR